MNPLLQFRRVGQGEPLVLVHGYLGGSAQWAQEMRDLSPHFDVIAVDLPGYGQSRNWVAPHTIQGFSEAVLALLDALHVSRFRLLGHSMGGMVVQEMARLQPQRISQLILYGTGPLGCIPGRFETMEQSRARLRADGLQATARRISARWFTDGEDAAGYPLCAQLACEASEDAALAGLNAMEGWDGRPALAALAMPTQIIWGEYDRSYRFDQVQALWQGIPHSSLAVIPRACHAAHLEQPALFRDILRIALNHPGNGAGTSR